MSAFSHFLRYYAGLDRADTQTTAAERDALRHYAGGRRALLEIGVYEGVTTTLLASAMDADGELWAVDPFLAGRLGISWQKRIARSELRRAHVQRRVRFIEKFSHAAAADVSPALDFVFVDGDHSMEGITADWTLWSARVITDGIIALHDTLVPPHNPRVAELGSVRYFDTVIRHDPRFAVAAQVDSLTVLRRTASSGQNS